MRPALDRVAVIGAGGFLGSRLIETSVVRGERNWVPVLRSVRGYARLGRLGVPYVRADTDDVESLRCAIRGCAAVVNVTLGESHRMVRETSVFITACKAERVRTFVHLSSAAVFDDFADPAITDASRPLRGHWMLYARQKGACEELLRKSFGDAESPCTVILRPGLIWGPRSPWSLRGAQALDQGEVWLAADGRGVCNLIHVDNVVRCVRRVALNGAGRSGAYSISDPATITWGQWYLDLAKGLGYPEQRVRTCGPRSPSWSKARAAEWLKQRDTFYRLTRWLIPRISGGTKSRLKALLPSLAGGGFVAPVPIDVEPPSREPSFTREQWSLQNTRRKLAMTQFHEDFGDPSLMSYEESLDLTLRWLRFAGYGGRTW